MLAWPRALAPPLPSPQIKGIDPLPKNISSLSPSPSPVQSQPSKGTVRSPPELHRRRARTRASPASRPETRVAANTAGNCVKRSDQRVQVAAGAEFNPLCPPPSAERSLGRGKLSSLLKYPKNGPLFPVSAGTGACSRRRAPIEPRPRHTPRTHTGAGACVAAETSPWCLPESPAQSGWFPELDGKNVLCRL